jgi:hypothetical protein
MLKARFFWKVATMKNRTDVLKERDYRKIKPKLASYLRLLLL